MQKNEDRTEKPVIYIMPAAKEKLDLYVEIASGEISGLGKVEKIEECLVITDILLFEQQASSSYTNIDPKPVLKLLRDIADQNGDPSVLKLWWHSHANMDTFWSGTDNTTMAGLAQDGWMLSLELNKKGNYKLCFLLYSPIKTAVDDLILKVYHPPDDKLRKAIEEEIKAKVRPMGYSTRYVAPGTPVTSSPAVSQNRYVGGFHQEEGWSGEWDKPFPEQEDKKGPEEVENFQAEVIINPSIPIETGEIADDKLLAADEHDIP